MLACKQMLVPVCSRSHTHNSCKVSWGLGIRWLGVQGTESIVTDYPVPIKKEQEFGLHWIGFFAHSLVSVVSNSMLLIETVGVFQPTPRPGWAESTPASNKQTPLIGSINPENSKVGTENGRMAKNCVSEVWQTYFWSIINLLPHNKCILNSWCKNSVWFKEECC